MSLPGGKTGINQNCRSGLSLRGCDLHPIDWIREGFMMGPFSEKGR
jgi:hypothetical protein